MSEIRATTISDSAGTGPITLTKQSAAKAWVNFNGTGTIAIRDSYSVSSITDQGTGNYTATISSAMSSSSNYALLAMAGNGGNNPGDASTSCNAYTSTSGWHETMDWSGTNVDRGVCVLVFHGDLA